MSNGPPLQTQLVPGHDATTSVPPLMVPPLQFLHVPGRPNSTRRSGRPGSRGVLQPPTKVPVAVFSLNRLPSEAQLSSLASSQQQQQLSSPHSSGVGSRPPTAPTHEWFTKEKSRMSSAQTARVLFRRSAPSSASFTVATTQDDEVREDSRGIEGATRRSPPCATEDVSWTDRSPRVASGSKRQPPPLATALQSHLEREVKILQEAADREEGNSGVVDPMEILQPHREALRMLAEGLPSYSGLIHNIMVAYDAAIRNQAEVTAAARVISNTAVEVRASHEAEVSDLRQAIETVEGRCRTAQQALQAKMLETKASTANVVVSSVEKENMSLRQQVADLETERTSDLEKMMTLIIAIKECDSRVKSLEEAVQDARSKLDDMNVLKKMMGESQSELGQLKIQFKDAVPLTRYTNATRELESHLLESRKEIKRVRRLCIARGSAIEGLEKKLKAASDELDRFRMAAGSKQVRDALTPRPDWLAVQRAVPELSDFAADVPVEMIDDNHQQAPRLVGGLKESSLQVGFLVEKIDELQQQLSAVMSSGDSQTPSKESPALTPSAGDATSSSPSLLKHRQSIANVTSPAPVSRTCLSQRALPLLALGTSVSAVHLKEVGVVPRVAFEKGKLRSMMHDFFISTQKKYAVDMELSPPTANDIVKHYVSFCTVLFANYADVRQQVHGNMAYLAYNLAEAAVNTSLPQVILFQHVLAGTIPLRIALDALRVEDEVRRELSALCEAHNKTRLRRATVLELIVPLLPFKSREEVEELRTALGVESTVDVSVLVVPSSKFMSTLFEQECAEGVKLYVALVEKLTASSTVIEGVRCTTTAAVLDVVADVEPHTEQRVIDALIKGDVNEESVFPLEHTLQALRSVELVRASPAPGGNS
jgi:predicted  nucleic acid-binding Zn-ribbon protein